MYKNAKEVESSLEVSSIQLEAGVGGLGGNGIMIRREAGYQKKNPDYEATEYTLTWRGEIYSFASPNKPANQLPNSPTIVAYLLHTYLGRKRRRPRLVRI